MAGKNGASLLKAVISRDDVAALLVMSDRNVSRLTKMDRLKVCVASFIGDMREQLPRDSRRERKQVILRYAEHFRRSHDAVICVYDAAGNVIETHEHKGDFKEP
jgi:hypothetical protein